MRNEHVTAHGGGPQRRRPRPSGVRGSGRPPRSAGGHRAAQTFFSPTSGVASLSKCFTAGWSGKTFMKDQKKTPLSVTENESHWFAVIESWNTTEENTTRAMSLTTPVMMNPTAEVSLITWAITTLRQNAMQAFGMRYGHHTAKSVMTEWSHVMMFPMPRTKRHTGAMKKV